jgi:hypothetical protein
VSLPFIFISHPVSLILLMYWTYDLLGFWFVGSIWVSLHMIRKTSKKTSFVHRSYNIFASIHFHSWKWTQCTIFWVHLHILLVWDLKGKFCPSSLSCRICDNIIHEIVIFAAVKHVKGTDTRDWFCFWLGDGAIFLNFLGAPKILMQTVYVSHLVRVYVGL